MNHSTRHYLTHEEKEGLPPTFLGGKIREHGNYPIDFPIPPHLPLESILPEDRSAVLLYYTHMRNLCGTMGTPEEVCPIYQAPPKFSDYIDKCCEDLAANSGKQTEFNVNHWLYPGFYVADGHVLAAMLISYLPEFVEFPWPHLLALDMRGYRHADFPLDVCHLRDLKLLFAGDNQMQKLPPTIEKLSALRALTIENTHITALPEGICRLHSLIYLNISNMLAEPFHLNSLPVCIGNLISLCHLNLHNNCLTTLPNSVGNLRNLSYLDLSYNQFAELPASLVQCHHLAGINLHANHFTEFPAFLASLPSCYVDLGHNYLRSLYGVPQSKYREISAVLPQRVFEWISNDQFDAIAAYYALSLLDIAESLVRDGTITELETERLLHEATPAIRQYLENHLPPTHPIITALAERWTVEIANDSDHHHIFL